MEPDLGGEPEEAEMHFAPFDPDIVIPGLAKICSP
jgi:hypothetical protein